MFDFLRMPFVILGLIFVFSAICNSEWYLYQERKKKKEKRK